jgi:serine/threonine protein kinase
MWSLGVTFFQILTGKLPFKSKDTAILIEEIKKGVFNIP